MGGKPKSGNRTKNNTKPSSSGRSAAVLNSTLSKFPNAVGLSPFVFNQNEDADTAIDQNFQLIFKKISKKDSTTKLKGLQELSELVKASEVGVLKGILGLWVRHYNQLSTDLDHKVREATQIAHHEIVLKVKRNIAPYLKQIMAIWFVSQYDNYAPAASVACQAFKDTFSSAKFQEAIVFCQEPILNYISDNLLTEFNKLTPDPQLTPEEVEAKYERIIVCCLQGYSLYFEEIPTDQIQNAADHNSKIISNKLFWNLPKNKSAHIRAAWYKVISTILQKAIFLFDKKKTEILTLILNHLTESNPIVLPQIFECLLMGLTIIPNWSQYLNVSNVFLPKLNKLLIKGGAGNATIIYPSLLPLLSQLISVIESNNVDFYNNFLCNMLIGLKLKTVVNDRSEAGAICTSFLECLQFIIIKNFSNKGLCESLLKEQLLKTIEWSLTNENTFYKTLFIQTSSLLHSISKKQSEENYLNVFFDNLQKMFIKVLTRSNESDIALVSDKQIELLHALKQIHKPKKYCKVKFNLETTESDTLHKLEPEDTKHSEEYLNILMASVFKIFAKYVQFIDETHSNVLLEKVCSIILDFDKKELLNSIVENMKAKNPRAKLFDVYTNLFNKWLHYEKLYSKNVIDLIFMLILHLNDDQKHTILNELLLVETYKCLEWCLSEALSFPYNEMTVVRKWLKKGKIGEFILTIVDLEITDNCPPDLDRIYKLILLETIHGDYLLSYDVILKIIEKITKAVNTLSEDSLNLDKCCTLASHLCNAICSNKKIVPYTSKLILEMIKVSCYKLDEELISAETLKEFNTTWHDALTVILGKLNIEETNELFTSFGEIIEKFLFWRQMEIVKKDRVDHMVNIILQFIRAVYKSVPIAFARMQHLCFETEIWVDLEKFVHYYCKTAEYIDGGLANSLELMHRRNDFKFTEIRVLQYFIFAYIKYTVFSSKVYPCDDDDEDEDGILKDLIFLNVNEVSSKALADGVHAFVLGEDFLINFPNIKFYHEILTYNTHLEEGIIDAKVCKRVLDEAGCFLLNNALKFGWIWCKTTKYFYKEILHKTDLSHLCDYPADDATPIGKLHCQQVFTDNHKYVKREFKLEDIENMYSEVILHYSKLDLAQWVQMDYFIDGIRWCSQTLNDKNCDTRIWDAVFKIFDKFIKRCVEDQKHFWKFTQYQALLCSLQELYITMCKTIKQYEEQKINKNIIDEWKYVVKDLSHGYLIEILSFFANTFGSPVTFIEIPFVHKYIEILDYLDISLIYQKGQARNTFSGCCGLLSSNNVDIQQWGYRMVSLLLPGLIEIDNALINNETSSSTLTFVFNQFEIHMKKYENVINNLLAGIRIGENTCTIESSYHSFTTAIAYLLLWDFILVFYEQSPVELRSTYVDLDWLKSGFLNLVPNVAKLMPVEIIQCNESPLKDSMKDIFLKNTFTVEQFAACDSHTIEELSCYLYKSSFTNFPAMVRQWWAGLDAKTAHVIEKVTTAYVSSHLCKDELNDVVKHQNQFKNMKIKVAHSIRQIIAVYKIDDAKIELTINLPPNYPLVGPAVNCNRQISGISKNKQWIFDFQKCVLHQNGRLRDGLAIWNYNLDRKFDKIEECYICYSILHPVNYQLPKLSCRTCKNKFHSTCLYTWFSSSNKSSCPICRNLF